VRPVSALVNRMGYWLWWPVLKTGSVNEETDGLKCSDRGRRFQSQMFCMWSGHVTVIGSSWHGSVTSRFADIHSWAAFIPWQAFRLLLPCRSALRVSDVLYHSVIAVLNGKPLHISDTWLTVEQLHCILDDDRTLLQWLILGGCV